MYLLKIFAKPKLLHCSLKPFRVDKQGLLFISGVNQSSVFNLKKESVGTADDNAIMTQSDMQANPEKASPFGSRPIG